MRKAYTCRPSYGIVPHHLALLLRMDDEALGLPVALCLQAHEASALSVHAHSLLLERFEHTEP